MPRIVVIGASQGGVQALQTLVSGLGTKVGAPILIVLHVGGAQSILPSILSDIDGIKASHPVDRERIQPGQIYVAPPDHHMLVTDGHIELSRGPRENWARPAIDPLFRSAAESYGPEAIGVVLSGRLNDGTAGLYEIKRRGGTAIVQTPSDAESPDMPRSALENVPVDYCLPVGEMPRLLIRLAGESLRQRSQIVHGGGVMEPKIESPSAQTCPECGGAMREESIGKLTRFRCHIGHMMTAEVLAAQQVESLENDFSALLRRLNERTGLCREIADKHFANGHHRAGETWSRAAEESAGREIAAQQLVRAEWVHPEDGGGKEEPAAEEKEEA